MNSTPSTPGSRSFGSNPFQPGSGPSSPASTVGGSFNLNGAGGRGERGGSERPQSPTAMTANAKRTKYLRRIFKFRQMDFEYAFWQMLYLFISPQKVYVLLRTAPYRCWSHLCYSHT